MYYLDTPIADEWGYESYAIAKYQLKEEVIAHSPNIIDVIDVGDYVNGERVIYIDNLTGSLRQYNVAGEDIEKTCGHWQEDIKSVVTHEQFESIKYRLE